MRRRSNTQLKLLAIVGVLFVTLFYQRGMIQAVWQDQSLSRPQAALTIVQRLLNIPQNRPQDPQNHVIQSGSSQAPHQVSAAVQASPQYQKAAQVAYTFNQSLDVEALNQAFINRMNQGRTSLGWQPIELGTYLAAGSQVRVDQLSDYYYLSSQTVEGTDFRTVYPEISSAITRLGESTFELYISAEDVHLATWRQHPEILADYLYQTFGKASQQETGVYIRSQYVTVAVRPSDQLTGDIAYVRLVAVLTSDTQGQE